MTCWCYILECKNNAQYTGITKDLAVRYRQHNTGKGAKYTRMNKVEKIIYAIALPTRSDACRLERELKKMGRAKRDIFINSNSCYYKRQDELGEQKILVSFLSPSSSKVATKSFTSSIDLETLTPIQNRISMVN